MLKRASLAVLAVLILAASSFAQKTTVNATIVDPQGIPYANGTVSAALYPAGISNPTVGGNAINGFVGPGVTNFAGAFSMDLFSNPSISPSGTAWVFTICNPGVDSPLGFGNVCFTSGPLTISGSVLDLSATLSALAPPLTHLGGSPVTFPRLDQVLDPGANRIFNLGGFTFGATNGPVTFAGATSLIVPSAVGITTSVLGQIGCNTTTGNCHLNNGSDLLVPLFNGATFGPGDVMQLNQAGATWSVGDAGPLTSPVGTTIASYTPVGVQQGDVMGFDVSGALFNFTLGLTPDQITASSYTYTGAERREVVFFTATGAKTAALPQASELTAFNSNWNIYPWNNSTSGNVVTTVSGSLFYLYNGTTSSTLTQTPGEWCILTSDASANSGNGYYYPLCAQDPALAASGNLSGTLTANSVPVASAPTTLINSTITDDGTNPSRMPNGADTAKNGNYEEYTVDTGGVTGGLALCATSNVDGSGRPKVLACSHSASQPGAGFVGIAKSTVAAAGTVEVCWTVNCSATFDNTSVALNEAILSTTTDGQMHDTGSQAATAGQPNFAVLNANSGTGTASLISLTGLLAQNPTGGGGNGRATQLQFNGTTSKNTVNFNASTPAPGAGFLAATWATSNAGSTTSAIAKIAISGNTSTVGTTGTMSGSAGAGLCDDGSHNITNVGCSSGGVNSFTGDGTLFNNVGSTGSVTLSPVSLSPNVAFMGPASSGASNFVQSASAHSNAATSLVLGYTNPLGTGHLLIAATACFNGFCDTNSVTSTHNGTWSKAFNINHGAEVTLYYVCNSVGGADTVTLTSGGSSFEMHLQIFEFSGNATASCLDQTGTATPSSTTAFSATTGGSVSQATELLFGAISSNNSPAPQPINGTGTWSTQINTLTTQYDLGTVISTQSTGLSGTQTVTADSTVAASLWSGGIATFKLNTSGSAPGSARAIVNSDLPIHTPSVCASCAPTATGQTSAIADTVLDVPASNQLYRFTGEINCTASSASATATLNLKWTDTSNTAQTLSVTSTCTTLGASSLADMVHGIRAKAGTNITYGVTIANTPTFDVDARLEKMN